MRRSHTEVGGYQHRLLNVVTVAQITNHPTRPTRNFAKCGCRCAVCSVCLCVCVGRAGCDREREQTCDSWGVPDSGDAPNLRGCGYYFTSIE